MGQGLRRRPGHADRDRASPCCGSTGSAPWSTSTRASSARTRWSPRSTTACTARAGRRRRSTPRCTRLVDAAHVDHLHPDCGHRAGHGRRRRGADRGDLRRRGGVGAVAAARVPARPGHRGDQGGDNPQAIGCVLGGHGITAWGATRDEAEARLAAASSGPPRPSSPSAAGRAVRPARRRSAAAARGRAARAGRRARPARPGARLDGPPQVGHFTDTERGARLPGPRRALAAGRARHLLPGPLPAHQGAAAGAGPARRRAPRGRRRAARASCTPQYRADYRRYYERHADARLARRCAAPTRRSCWSPGVGMFSFGATSRPPGWPGEFYVNAINVMRGAEAVSTLRARSTRPRSSASSTGRWRRPSSRGCRSPSRWPPGSRSSPAPGRASGGRSRDRLAAEGACVVVADLNAGERARPWPRDLGGPDVAVAVHGGRHRPRTQIARGVRRRGPRLRRRRPGRQQRRPLHLQAAARDHRPRLGPAARRHGPRLVPGRPRGRPGR